MIWAFKVKWLIIFVNVIRPVAFINIRSRSNVMTTVVKDPIFIVIVMATVNFIQALTYEINIDRNLHDCNYSCAVGPDVSEYQFNSLNLSQTYTFGLHADNCNNTQQGLYSKLIVTLGGE